MTSKELRRLSRQDLLELLIRQEQENEQLEQTVAELEERLRKRNLIVKNAGSMAEAAMTLNGVFAAADEAVAQYKENLRRYCEDREKIYGKIVREAEDRAKEIIRAAEEEKKRMIKEAVEYQGRNIREVETLWRGCSNLEKPENRLKTNEVNETE